MSYSRYISAILATLVFAPCADGDDRAENSPDLDGVLQPVLERIRELVETFRCGQVSPTATAQFEKDLQQLTRELGRVATEWTYNHVEPAEAASLPSHVDFEGNSFRRLKRKTPQEVSTSFGPIRLLRLGYRTPPAVGEPVLFPLCRELGLVHSATPALVERVARYMAESGATQRQTLERLRADHGVRWGVKRLRQVSAFVAEAMEEHRTEAQVEKLLHWLEQAQASRGRNRPVLSVGRDGITLGLQIKCFSIYEVATTGTVTVYDRRRRRLGTVYLAHTPEPGQGAMSRQLTALLLEVLRQWQGPEPRLSYVTDAGDNETAYCKNTLRRLRHPLTGKRLEWFWVVDYYHASERLWTMGEALFGKGHQSGAWTRKMQKLLLKPSGVNRVLHSAAALRSRMQLTGNRLEEFSLAYRYLQTRRTHLRYSDYRRLGLPIGSGVTEAACKTVYTQRLKLSGMRWKKAGAEAILRLRVILLSGVWANAYERTVKGYSRVTVRTPAQLHPSAAEIAA